MNKYFLGIAFISLNLFAVEPGGITFGRIEDLKGSGFISFQGKTREIRKGDSIELGSEIVIEHHGQVTFTDNADHRFHLGNASSVSVNSKSLELRSGDLWFQSLNKNDDYKISTANALINYQGGEAILSYDTVKGKTQLMVINGVMKLSNLRAPDLNLSVSEGHFSFIDNAYDEGAPRDPTAVGEKTYGELVSLFSGVAPMDKNSVTIFKNQEKSEHGTAIPKTGRTVASVASEKEDNKFQIDQKVIEEYKHTLFDKSKSKKGVTNKLSTSKVGGKKVASEKMVIHIYGQVSTPSLAPDSITAVPTAMKSRAPASVIDQDVPKEDAPTVSPYSKYFKNQNKESTKLIDDLKKL